MFLVGFAVGMGVGRGYIPGIAQSGIALYGALPFSIKGLGMVKHFARGYIAGMVVSGITGINLGNMTGIGAGGSTAASPWG